MTVFSVSTRHDLHYKSTFAHSDGFWYMAFCGCGWEGKYRVYDLKAHHIQILKDEWCSHNQSIWLWP